MPQTFFESFCLKCLRRFFYLKGVFVVIVALKDLKLSSTVTCASTAKPLRNSSIPVMEVLFKGRTFLLRFVPQPAFARREETLTYMACGG